MFDKEKPKLHSEEQRQREKAGEWQCTQQDDDTRLSLKGHMHLNQTILDNKLKENKQIIVSKLT